MEAVMPPNRLYVNRESVIYDPTAIYLRDATSKEEVGPIFRQQPQKTSCQNARSSVVPPDNEERIPAPDGSLRSTPQVSSSSSADLQEAQMTLRRLAQQEMN